MLYVFLRTELILHMPIEMYRIIILYKPREKGGRSLPSIEDEYKVTRIMAAVKLYRNGEPAVAMVREFEERAEKLGHSSFVKEAARYAEEIGLQLQLE